ncbi:hypothetical protein BJX68DRAFT_47203 [Aspergillus pseudodeflectus]|uniref:Uncharacterized protein n=1 Tax=Aspergillus pseudodeflectus TaxID=176178 RepID=A0ABR4J7G3_9EURO
MFSIFTTPDILCVLLSVTLVVFPVLLVVASLFKILGKELERVQSSSFKLYIFLSCQYSISPTLLHSSKASCFRIELDSYYAQ